MPDIHAVVVPVENINDEFAILVEWNTESGREVKKGDVIATLETQKATFELEAEEDGFLFYDIEEGAEVSIGSEIAYISKENQKPQIKKTDTAKNEGYDGGDTISAKALKLMKDYGLRREDFAGRGKIKTVDVKAMISELGMQNSDAKSRPDRLGQGVPAEPVDISASKKYEIRQLNKTSQRVVASSVSIMVDMRKVDDHIHNILKNDGIQVTLVELIIARTAKLLNKYRLFNGFYYNGSCNVYKEINIGFAVNIGKGLKVPVLRNTDSLTLQEISNSVKDLSLKYFREELNLKDLSGGTFTVTDLSARGIVDFNPVINDMQSAILGVCAVEPGTHYFKLILTFDHKMADGMIAADMLNELSSLLQES